jgi:DNA polymerase-3 subunit alpha
VIESLAKAGAFDSLGHARRAVVAVHDQAVDEAIDLKRNEAHGQFDLFSMGEPSDSGDTSRLTVVVPELTEWDKQTKLAHERDMLGLYVSDHPLFGVEHVLATGADCTIGQLLADEERPDGTPVTIGGLITSVQRKVNKRGDIYAIVTVEDLEGSIEVMMFSSAYQLAAHLLVNDAIVLIKGRVRRRDDRLELSGSDVTVPDLTEGPTGPVVITMPVNRCTPPLVEQLRDVLKTHPGMTEVQLRLQARSKTTVMRLDDRLRVTPTPALMADLKALLGPSCLAG